MEHRTERLLRAIGTREGYAVVAALLAQELTTSRLAEETHFAGQTLDHALEILSQAGVVGRRPGTQGAWYIVHWPEVFAVLEASRRLGVAVQGSAEHAESDERDWFARLEAAGGAAPPAKRGRPR